MLKKMQIKYAAKPVRFLLFPCDEFGQEPGTNAEVKAFAETYLSLGAGSDMFNNVIMFAKSNVNNVTCVSGGCNPATAGCCPQNDAVYRYLLSVVSPDEIEFNFDIIMTDANGVPYRDGLGLRGGASEQQLSEVIDELLENINASSTRGLGV